MQEKYEIQISLRAKNDLINIVKYIKDELKEPSIAEKYASIIKEKIRDLEYNLQRYSIVDNNAIKDLQVRKLIIKRYIIFYRVSENKRIVIIDRILYGASNWINEL